jgi:hypothetical protein
MMGDRLPQTNGGHVLSALSDVIIGGVKVADKARYFGSVEKGNGPNELNAAEAAAARDTASPSV